MSPAAVAQLAPFLIDGVMTFVLAPADRRVQPSKLLVQLNATCVRPVEAREVTATFVIGYVRPLVYMDDELLTHPEILVCVEPPLDLAVGPAIAVRRILRAEQISHG